MNNNLKEYIESFDNIIWLYRDIIDNKILENENLKNIDNETKKELFDYIFDKYLDSESELNSLSIDARYYGFFRLKDIEIFLPIEEYCNNKIRDEIEKIKISNVRNIFMHLDMIIFLDDKSLLNEIQFDEYLSFISGRIKDINYGNGYYYAKSMSLIFIINLLLEKIKEKEDIDKILDAIKKFDEFGQYNILEYIIYSLTKEEIQSDLIYDNLIKYCIELFNEEKLRKSHLNKRITKILEVIIDYISKYIERLKFILDIYFSKDEKELNEIYKYIDYEQRYKLDIPIYCLSRLNNRVDLEDILSIEQYTFVIMYLALYIEKDNRIIIKNVIDENIDLSVYWNLVRNQFLEYCNNYEIEKNGLFFLDRYRNLLEVLSPTKEEFVKFSEHSKIFFYHYIIKRGNDELYSLIPDKVKEYIETDEKYKEKIEEEKQLFQKERTECVHKFFDRNKIIGDINKIIEVLGNNPTFEDLNSYNNEFYKDKKDNKEKYLESEITIINPFIRDYFLMITKYLIKDISMEKIKKYVENYWYKHWGIQLYNYLKRHGDIIDKVNFSEEEKIEIKKYFRSSNYKENIKGLYNCSEGTFDNSYIYFVFYNLGNIFKDIKFEYDEEILINMLKIPYYYYKGDIKLYNNNYYLDYMGIILEDDDDNVDFDNFFKYNDNNYSKELKISVLKKLIETINKYRITEEFGSYYTLLSIIKLCNSNKECYQSYYYDIVKLVAYFYTYNTNYTKNDKSKMKTFKIPNIITNFIKENNFDDKSFITLINNDSLTPIKIDIKGNIYTVYNLKDNSIILDDIDDIDDLVNRLFPIDFNLSRILKFQYLLNDIKNSVLTISHPYVFEDKNECLYNLENKTYIACFSNTTDNKNAYAWWKIYGITPDDNLHNIKVRMLISKRDLLKNILLKKDKNFEYYFGYIKYIKDKKEKNENIKDFFEKSNSFQFEKEFRVLVDCKCRNDYRIKRDCNNIPYLLELPINSEVYKNITIDNELSFDPYKNLEDKHKNVVKYLLKEAQDKI